MAPLASRIAAINAGTMYLVMRVFAVVISQQITSSAPPLFRRNPDAAISSERGETSQPHAERCDIIFAFRRRGWKNLT